MRLTPSPIVSPTSGILTHLGGNPRHLHSGSSISALRRRADMASMEGLRLGAYQLIGRIGGGGMAGVYRARQLSAFGREVAIKVIRAGFGEDATFRERFLREAQAISRLSHPNILPLIEFGEGQPPFGEDHALLYLVM